jgi:hypothetical protein
LRKVVYISSRQAHDTLELEDADGKRISINTTLNHPFHVEDWDGEVETLVADLSQLPAIDPSRLFPSDDKTRFGDWVKAGALKLGDKVSTLGSVPDFILEDNASGPRAAANDNGSDNAANNQPLTVTEILRDNTPTRVYNFEVESRNGEITHNYFVGEDQAWVHNARGSAWKTIFNNPNTPNRIRGWILQELNRGRTFSNLRSPPSCDLGHLPSNRGPHGPTSRPETPRDNRSRPGITENNLGWR